MTEKEFVELIGPLAAADYKESGILASITAAQACLESGYGSTDLAQNANNLFGMKETLSGNTWDSVWDGTSVYRKKTAEQDKNGNVYYVWANFRKYPSIQESIRDHSLYLTQARNGSALRYAGLVGCQDYRRAAQIIKDGGYATDVQYVSKLCSLIERWNLTQYDKEVETVSVTIHREHISQRNINGTGNPCKYIVIHETDNYSKGAGAKTHAKAQHDGNFADMSVHYYCGSDGIYQAAEHTCKCWHIGREYGGNHSIHDATNNNSIGIEICVNSDGNYTVARQNAIELVKYLLQTTGIPASRVIRHFDAKGKYCPRKMLDTPSLWTDFKNQISGASGGSSVISGAYQTGVYRVTVDDLTIRTGPSTKYEACGNITDHGSYTITEIQNTCWGKLLSGAGWICIDRDFCEYAEHTPDQGVANTIIAAGQIHANNFAGCGLEIDGIRGTDTKKAGIKVVQHAMNLDYGTNLEEDGVWGEKSAAALEGHYVKKGETQYMVTALEILFMLRGIECGGVESPGVFGDGLYDAVYTYKKEKKWDPVNGSAGKGTFISLMGVFA